MPLSLEIPVLPCKAVTVLLRIPSLLALCANKCMGKGAS